jgi:two-component system sensor histidine kinase KdpD
VSIAIPEELPPVAVDAILFDQVLTNLLENAVRHTPPEAPIRVVGAPAGSGMLRLCVEDGGPGVPAQAVEHLFDKFYRGPAPAGRSRIGSGLGLAVVRGFVEAMGGSVAARPSELGGLAVDVELRAATQPASVPPDGAAREAVTR